MTSSEEGKGEIVDVVLKLGIKSKLPKRQTFVDLLENKKASADVKIVFDVDLGNETRQEFVCHRLLLIMSSPVFEIMFDGPSSLELDMDDCGRRVVYLKNADPIIFRLLLKFVYMESIHFESASELVSLFKLGERFQIKGLRAAILKLVMTEAGGWSEAVNALYAFAAESNDNDLKDFCFKAISRSCTKDLDRPDSNDCSDVDRSHNSSSSECDESETETNQALQSTQFEPQQKQDELVSSSNDETGISPEMPIETISSSDHQPFTKIPECVSPESEKSNSSGYTSSVSKSDSLLSAAQKLMEQFSIGKLERASSVKKSESKENSVECNPPRLDKPISDDSMSADQLTASDKAAAASASASSNLAKPSDIEKKHLCGCPIPKPRTLLPVGKVTEKHGSDGGLAPKLGEELLKSTKPVYNNRNDKCNDMGAKPKKPVYVDKSADLRMLTKPDKLKKCGDIVKPAQYGGNKDGDRLKSQKPSDQGKKENGGARPKKQAQDRRHVRSKNEKPPCGYRDNCSKPSRSNPTAKAQSDNKKSAQDHKGGIPSIFDARFDTVDSSRAVFVKLDKHHHDGRKDTLPPGSTKLQKEKFSKSLPADAQRKGEQASTVNGTGADKTELALASSRVVMAETSIGGVGQGDSSFFDDFKVPPSGVELFERQMLITEKMAAVVQAKGCERLHRIMAASEAGVIVHDALEDNSKRLITIKGSLTQIKLATEFLKISLRQNRINPESITKLFFKDSVHPGLDDVRIRVGTVKTLVGVKDQSSPIYSKIIKVDSIVSSSMIGVNGERFKKIRKDSQADICVLNKSNTELETIRITGSKEALDKAVVILEKLCAHFKVCNLIQCGVMCVCRV